MAGELYAGVPDLPDKRAGQRGEETQTIPRGSAAAPSTGGDGRPGGPAQKLRPHDDGRIFNATRRTTGVSHHPNRIHSADGGAIEFAGVPQKYIMAGPKPGTGHVQLPFRLEWLHYRGTMAVSGFA